MVRCRVALIALCPESCALAMSHRQGDPFLFRSLTAQPAGSYALAQIASRSAMSELTLCC